MMCEDRGEAGVPLDRYVLRMRQGGVSTGRTTDK